MTLKALRAEARAHGVEAPQKKTLERYGLTETTWLELLKAQGWVCPICEKGQRTWNIDHEHVPGFFKWPYTMPPEERPRYVRGILCWFCNHKRVHSSYRPGEAARIAAYQEAYERRRDA